MRINENIKSISGDPKKAIKKLSLPIVLTMLLAVANNLVDSIWVSGLGVGPLAAMGFTTPIFLVLVGIGAGVGAGANSLLSRFVGAEDSKGVNNGAIHSLLISIVICIILTVFFAFALEPILYLMGAGSVINYGLEYGYIIVIFSFTIILPNVFSGMFRAEGDIKRATLSLALAAIINLILNPIFIYTLNLGIKGSAIATVVASFINLLIFIYWMFIKKDTFFSYDFKNFKYQSKIVKDILVVSLPASLEEILMAVVSIVLNYLVEITGGTIAVASFTAGWRILSMAIIPPLGIAISSITVVGIAFGAKKFKNLRTSVRYTVKLGLIYSIIITILLFIFANQISLLFSYSTNSVTISNEITKFLRIMGLYIIPVAFGTAAASAFQGMGKGFTSLSITLLREVILVSIFAYLFSIVFGFGVLGVYIGLILGDIIGCAIGYIGLEYYIFDLVKKAKS